MLGIAPGEAALDAAVAAIGLAVLPRHHAHQFLAPHFRAEGAAHATIGAGSDDGAVGCAGFHDLLLDQGCGRAGLHTRPTGHAFRAEKILTLRSSDLRFKSLIFNGEGKRPLHLFAGPYAA